MQSLAIRERPVNSREEAAMSAARPMSYEFGAFRLDSWQQVLMRDQSVAVSLTPRAYDLLLYFLEHPGQLLTKSTLMKAIWPGTVVEENNLSQHVSVLRRALGEGDNGARYIVTVPRRGYRFIANVQISEPATGSASAHGLLSAPSVEPSKASVAVLPFVNISGDSGKEYFGDGLAEEVIHLLSRVQGLFVAARTSSFGYKGRSLDVRSIAQELRVATILEGTVRWAGERLRMTAQLIDAASGYQIWSQSFDRSLDDLFGLQKEIATAIVEAIQSFMRVALRLSPMPSPPTRDPEAYRLYLQGAALATLGAEAGIRRGIDLLQHAVQRDPRFARALAALALRRIGLVYLHARPDDIRDIEQDAERALALDPALTGPHTALGMLNITRRRWLAAEEHFRAARALGERDPMEIVQEQYLTASVGQIRKSHDCLRECYERSPAEPRLLALLAVASLALPITPETTEAAAMYADLAMNLGMHKDANTLPIVRLYVALRRGQRAEVEDVAHDVVGQLLHDARTEGVRAIVAIQAAVADWRLRASALTAVDTLLDALQPARIGPVLAAQIVAWYTMLGALDQAYGFAERALNFATRHGTMGILLTWLWHPELYPLRKDGRFGNFVERLGMREFWQVHGPPDDCELRNGRLIVR